PKSDLKLATQYDFMGFSGRWSPEVIPRDRGAGGDVTRDPTADDHIQQARGQAGPRSQQGDVGRFDTLAGRDRAHHHDALSCEPANVGLARVWDLPPVAQREFYVSDCPHHRPQLSWFERGAVVGPGQV